MRDRTRGRSAHVDVVLVFPLRLAVRGLRIRVLVHAPLGDRLFHPLKLFLERMRLLDDGVLPILLLAA
jgi:hypothetical protein